MPQNRIRSPMLTFPSAKPHPPSLRAGSTLFDGGEDRESCPGCPRFSQLHALRGSGSLHAAKASRTGVFMLVPSHWQEISGRKARWLKLCLFPTSPLLLPQTTCCPHSTFWHLHPGFTSSHHQNHTVTSPSSSLCVQITLWRRHVFDNLGRFVLFCGISIFYFNQQDLILKIFPSWHEHIPNLRTLR